MPVSVYICHFKYLKHRWKCLLRVLLNIPNVAPFVVACVNRMNLNLPPPEGDARQQGGENPPPPPPLQPTMAEILAEMAAARRQQTEVMRMFMQHVGAQPQGPRAPPPLRAVSYADFLATHPPVFKEAREPLEADDWLRTVESKFGLLECTEIQKTLFAAQQLQGPAGAWWANFMASVPAGRQITWIDFKTAFRSYHIPKGPMERKRRQFQDLRQGSMSVHEYSYMFNTLAQYASTDADTDEKKKGYFLRGLNPKQQAHLILNNRGSFDDLVNSALLIEDVVGACVDDKKRKRAL